MEPIIVEVTSRKVGNTEFRFDRRLCTPHAFERTVDDYGMYDEPVVVDDVPLFKYKCAIDGSIALFGEDGKLEEFTSSYCSKVPELSGKNSFQRKDS